MTEEFQNILMDIDYDTDSLTSLFDRSINEKTFEDTCERIFQSADVEHQQDHVKLICKGNSYYVLKVLKAWSIPQESMSNIEILTIIFMVAHRLGYEKCESDDKGRERVTSLKDAIGNLLKNITDDRDRDSPVGDH